MVTMVVGTELDDNSLRKVSNDIERRFDRLGQDTGGSFMSKFADGAAADAPKVQKAIDKAADAVGNLRKEQARLDQLQANGASRDKLIAQSERVASATRAQSRAMSDANRVYQDLANSSGRMTTVMNGLSGALSNTRFAPMISSVEMLTARFRSVGLAAGGAAVGIAGVAVDAAAAGKAIYDLGERWDSISDNITISTDKIGDELDALTGVVGDVGSMTAAPLESIGRVVGQLAQNMPGLAANSEDIRVMGSNLAFLAENGQAVDIHALSQAFTVFGVSSSSAVATLDDLASQSRATQVPINDLISQLRTGAPLFKQFGMDIHSAAGFLGAFEGAGLDTNTSMTGLRSALKKLNDDSRGVDTALKDVITRIKELHDAGNDDAARDLAISTFGGKSFAPFLDAIESGTLSVDNLNKALGQTGITLQEMQEYTDDGAQGFQKLKNTISSDLKPVADGFFGVVNSHLSLMTGNLSDALGGFNTLGDRLDSVKSKLDALVNAQIKPDSALGQMLAPGGVPNQATRTDRPLGSSIMAPSTGVFDGLIQDPGWGYKDSSSGGDSSKKANIPLNQYSLDAIPLGQFPGEQPMGLPGRKPDQIDGPGSYVVDPQQVFDAQTAEISARQRAEEARRKVLELAQDNNATAADKNDAQTNLLVAERSYLKAQQDVLDAQQGTWKKMADSAKKFADGMDDIGAAIDPGFGASDGLAGLAENLTKFIGNIAAAPLLGPLAAIKTAAGDEGSGIVGMLASNGAFGRQFLPTKTGTAGYYGGYSPSALGPAALMPPGLMPSILQDTGSVPSGLQSRQAAAAIQQIWGDQLRGKIGGSRDSNTAPGTHDKGLSIDIPIGPDQMQLGDQINAWLQAHAQELGLEYSIWRDRGQYPGGGGFNQPGHQNHIDAHFNGASMPYASNGIQAPTADFSNFGAPGSKQAIANMIYQQAVGRGYNAHEAQSIVAYAIGESSLNPGISGGVQGDAEVVGLFQQKPAFAAGGGIDPSQRADPVANTYAYLNQLEKHRNLPIEQALPATSVGGPLASGPGAQPQDWGNLMQQASDLLAPTIPRSAGWGSPGSAGAPVAGSPGAGYPLPWSLGGPGMGGVPAAGGPGIGSAVGQPFAPPSGALGNSIGQSLIPGQTPAGVPGAGQGMTGAIGGLPLAGIQAAASGLDLLMPGAGAAANLGIQLANRTIGFAGQQVGNAVSGLFETFTLSGSKGPVDPMKTLPGRLLAGIAGARPALPNTAGGDSQKAQGNQQQQQNPQQNQGGPLVNIEQVNQAPGQEPSSVANEVASQFRSAELSTGAFRR